MTIKVTEMSYSTRPKARELRVDFSPPSIFQIPGGVVAGQAIGKAFFSTGKMSWKNAAWMFLETEQLISTMRNSTLFRTNHNVYTALRVSIWGIMALNALNGYMGEIDPNNQGQFEKASIQVWDYSYKITSIFSILRTCIFSISKQPIKAATLLGSLLVTALDEKGKLPQRVSDFWKATSGNTFLGWGIYLLALPQIKVHYWSERN